MCVPLSPSACSDMQDALHVNMTALAVKIRGCSLYVSKLIASKGTRLHMADLCVLFILNQTTIFLSFPFVMVRSIGTALYCRQLCEIQISISVMLVCVS